MSFKTAALCVYSRVHGGWTGVGGKVREANGVSWRPLTTPNTVATPQNSQDWQRKDRVGNV